MAQSQKEKWDAIKLAFLKQIYELDGDTLWTGEKEPKWWLEMMSTAREVAKITPFWSMRKKS